MGHYILKNLFYGTMLLSSARQYQIADPQFTDEGHKMFGSEPHVRVHPDTEPEPPFRFRFSGLAEPNLEHNVRFRFEHCS